MQTQMLENKIVDEVHGCTYVVTATRTLTEGEIHSAIRVALLRRRGRLPATGETLVIAVESAT